VSDHELRELVALVEKLKGDCQAWLNARYPASR